MRIKLHVKNKTVAFLSIAAVFIISGCVSVFNPYDGQTVSDTNMIPLKSGGPHEGSWETKQVGFKYSYTYNGNALNVSGDLSCYAASHHTLELVDSLVFRITFVDSDAKLIGTDIIWTLTNDNFHYQWQIKERTVILPPNTEAIGFSYTGLVREAGGNKGADEGGIQIDLWHSPLGGSNISN